MIARKIRRGRHSRDFPGLPIDSAREYECQARTGLHLVVDFAGTDTASLPVINSPCQRMELFNFQQSSANPDPELRFRHVLQNELRLQRSAEFPIGSMEAI